MSTNGYFFAFCSLLLPLTLLAWILPALALDKPQPDLQSELQPFALNDLPSIFKGVKDPGDYD